MMQTAELIAKEPFTKLVEAPDVPAGMKTILFHVHNDDGLEDRLQVALSIARTFGAHLHLLHVNPVEAYTVSDAFGTYVSAEIVKVLEDEGRKLEAKIEQHLAKEDVTWDYEEVTGTLMSHLIQSGALADLILTGREPAEHEFGGPAVTMIGNLLAKSRTPLFIVGDKVREIDLFGSAVVAWNGSYEAANALRSAVPLLKLASKVRLVGVDEDKPEGFPARSALEYLSRHDIHAEFVDRSTLSETVEEALLNEAGLDGASYIVMGGYSHSRAGEFLFGGVTRSLLKNCPVSLLMAH